MNFGLDKTDTRALSALPLGAVRAESWLLSQLSMMNGKMTGEMEKYPDYSDSEWLGESGENWERGPYYMRGLIAMAYTLDDPALIIKAERWVEAVLASQRDGGMFGPRSNEDWWSRMPVLMALRDYYEALEYRGRTDERIIPFMIGYFRYQEKMLPTVRLQSWARARGGDNIDSVYWLYNRLYDADNPSDTEWLLKLASLLHDQTQDWSYIMNETTVREHVVNTSQALKAPVLYWQQSGNEYDRSAFEKALFNIGIDHGRVDDLPNSDEAPRDNKPTRGSELCGIVEGMLSTEIALRILKEGWIGDRLEKLAYNALPSGYTYDYSAHVYYILQNQVMATNGYHEFDCDHGDSCAPGAPCGFDCCFANNHMGWPKFVQSMWMARADGAIVAAAYGPCTVNYNGISFTESTDYPFDGGIRLEYKGETREFTICLRIPEWCRTPSVTVNGKSFNAVPGDFAEVTRVWQTGDICALDFPMEIKTREAYNSGIAVTRGPLIFSLPIKEGITGLANNNARELKVPALGKLQNIEIRPRSAWNYALYDETFEYTVKTKEVSKHPFTPGGAPVCIKAKGIRVPGWSLDGNIAAVLPYKGVRADGKTASETIELIPYGCTRLKITQFPRVNADYTLHNKPEKITRRNKCYTEFSDITVVRADDYSLVISGEGGGKIEINGVFSDDITFKNGTAVINGLSSLISKREFAFSYTHYNNIRIYGAKAYSVSVIPAGEFIKPQITELVVRATSVTVQVNSDRSFCPCTISVGKKSGEYDITADGAKGDRTDINRLQPNSDYYIRAEARIGGALVFSRESLVHTLCDEREQEQVKEKKCGIFEISALPVFEGVQITFDKAEGASRYELEYRASDETALHRVSDIIFNPYKGGGCFSQDKTSLTLDDMSKSYLIKMYAYRDNSVVAESDEIKVDF